MGKQLFKNFYEKCNMPFDFGDIISGIFKLLFWGFVIFSFTNKKYRKLMKEVDEEEEADKITDSKTADQPNLVSAITQSAHPLARIKSFEDLANQFKPGLINIVSNIAAAVNAKPVALDFNKRYLQVALNGSWEDARQILRQLPNSDRILIEAGTPFIKRYGINKIIDIRALRPTAYIVADLKTVDMGEREANMAADAGANAIIGLGIAPIETNNALSATCAKRGIDMFLDLMNVEQPLVVLKQLEKLPKVVLLHRGVDETENDRAKTIPYFQINQIKGAYKMMVAVAGADLEHDVKSAVFNGADIVVLWKSFYKFDGNVGQLAEKFLAEIR